MFLKTALTLTLLFLLNTQVFSQNQPLVKVYYKDEAKRLNIVGALKENTEETLTILNLQTHTDINIKKNNITKFINPVTEEEASKSLGVAPIFCWFARNVIPTIPKQGKVASISGNIGYLNIGSGSGISGLNKLFIYRVGEEIKDPDTGKVLDTIQKKIADIEIIEVRENTSKFKVLGEFETIIKVGDIAKPPIKKHSIAVLPLEVAGVGISKTGFNISEKINMHLLKHKIPVVDRTELSKVLSEMILQRSGIFNKSTIQSIGKQIGAYAIVTGTISEDKKNYKVVNLKMTQIETGEVLYSLSVKLRMKIDDTPIRLNASSKVTKNPTTTKSNKSPLPKWLNLTYRVTVRCVGDKKWEEVIDKTGKVTWKYNELAKTKGYTELYDSKRKYSVRLTDKNMLLKKDGKWIWVANGRWATP